MSDSPRTLVVTYSRTGTTAALGDAIARRLAAHGSVDVETLLDVIDRRGPFGFVRSIFDTVRRQRPTLATLTHDAARYDLVVLGTPVWGSTVSAPMRTFLSAHAGRLPKVAFFLTDGLTSHEMVFHDMAGLVGAEPLATLGLDHDEVDRGAYDAAVVTFVDRLLERRDAPRSASERASAPESSPPPSPDWARASVAGAAQSR